MGTSLMKKSLHKDSLAESLREAEGFVDTVSEAAFRKCQRAVHQVTHKLESLDRVWRVSYMVFETQC